MPGSSHPIGTTPSSDSVGEVSVSHVYTAQVIVTSVGP